MEMSANAICEMVGSIVSVVGAQCLARARHLEIWGWRCFALSNVLFIFLSWRLGMYWMLGMQLVFLHSSITGLIRISKTDKNMR
jgi:hypothetical protein